MDAGTTIFWGGMVLLIGGIGAYIWSRTAWIVVCGVLVAVVGVAILFIGGSIQRGSKRAAEMAQYAHVWVVTESVEGKVEFWEMDKLPERPKDVKPRVGFKMPDGGMIHFDGSAAVPPENNKE